MMPRLPANLRLSWTFLGLIAISLFGTCPIALGQEPLHSRIDQIIEIGPLAAVASDAEFLRRATLDLTGTIPSSTESRAFLDDPAPNKREGLINRLLDSPRFPIHLANVFDVMLMERRPDKHVTTPEWQKYLQTSFEQNKPYDQLVREILIADGTDPNLRPASKFFLERDAEPNLMARDVGRIFFGMDLQCAQCHDHPLVDHFLQADYYGLSAFVNRTIVFTDAAQKKSFLGEKSDGDANFKSVFTGDTGNPRPQLPGADEIDEPRFRQGEDYVTPPIAGARPVPKYSRRAKLAELATNGSNRAFNVNIANRLWALMMGRGLVSPVDLHHPMNPPSHPEVLELITNELVAQKFSVKWMLRELALTRTYQRSIDPPVDATAHVATVVQMVPSADAESIRLKTVAQESLKLVNAAKDEWKKARTTLEPVETAWKKAEAAVAEAKKPVEATLTAIAKAQADTNAKQAVINAVSDAAAKSAEAAKLLANDKDLAGVVATLTAKQQKLNDELTALQKVITDQTAAHATTQAKLVEAYVPADAAYTAFIEARKPVEESRARYLALWNQHKTDSLAAAVQKKRLDVLHAHVAFGTATSNVSAALAAVDTAKQDLSAAIQSAEQQQVELTKLAVAMVDIEKSVLETTKQMDEAKAQLISKQTVIQSLAEAVAKSDAALQKLPGDTDLGQLIQKLKERQGPIAKEMMAIEQQMAVMDATAKGLVAKAEGAKQAFAAATNEMSVKQQLVTAKTNAVNTAITSAQAAQSSASNTRDQLIDAWTVTARVRPIKHLSPEQLTWAMMQATGVLDPQRPGADAELEKTLPMASVAADPVKANARQIQLESLLHEKNRGNINLFVSMYAQSAGQPQDDFFATPDQALFAGNGNVVVSWAASGQLAQRLASLDDHKQLADELYLSVLTRRPTEAEVAEVGQQLGSRPAEKPVVIRDLIWALVTTAEFRFNH